MTVNYFFRLFPFSFPQASECFDNDDDCLLAVRVHNQVTTAAYATATGYAEPRIVDIKRGDSGYGFNIMGGNAVGMPIYVSRILPGGVAAR